MDGQSYLKIKMDCNKLGCLKTFQPSSFSRLIFVVYSHSLGRRSWSKAVIHPEEISSWQVVIASDIGKT